MKPLSDLRQVAGITSFIPRHFLFCTTLQYHPQLQIQSQLEALASAPNKNPRGRPMLKSAMLINVVARPALILAGNKMIPQGDLI
jgi:hypothetical protein